MDLDIRTHEGLPSPEPISTSPTPVQRACWGPERGETGQDHGASQALGARVLRCQQHQGHQGLTGKGEGKAESSLGLTCGLCGVQWGSELTFCPDPRQQGRGRSAGPVVSREAAVGYLRAAEDGPTPSKCPGSQKVCWVRGQAGRCRTAGAGWHWAGQPGPRPHRYPGHPGSA